MYVMYLNIMVCLIYNAAHECVVLMIKLNTLMSSYHNDRLFTLYDIATSNCSKLTTQVMGRGTSNCYIDSTISYKQWHGQTW